MTRRRRPPAHLRLVTIPVVQSADEATPSPLPAGYSATEVIKSVVENLRSDANFITDEAMFAIADECYEHGLELRREQSAVLQQAVFEMVVARVRARLIEGLADNPEAPEGTAFLDRIPVAPPSDGLLRLLDTPDNGGDHD